MKRGSWVFSYGIGFTVDSFIIYAFSHRVIIRNVHELVLIFLAIAISALCLAFIIISASSYLSTKIIVKYELEHLLIASIIAIPVYLLLTFVFALSLINLVPVVDNPVSFYIPTLVLPTLILLILIHVLSS